MEIVIDAMELKKFKQNENIILQGAEGNELFVVESGILICTKNSVFFIFYLL